MYRFFSDLQKKLKFKSIVTYGLYGKSGTGKSHNAFNIMDKHNINTIIDDGLLIHHGSIVAGKSAKKAGSRMEAVRRAIFFDEYHKNQVQNAISDINTNKILIIGTSKRMINKITARLGLTSPIIYINILDIVNEDDLKKADYFRNFENKHIIPVAAVELTKNFPSGLVDYIEHFITSKIKKTKSVVRPAYNIIGKVRISKNVIISYIKTFFQNFYLAKLENFYLNYNYKMTDKGINLKIYISINYRQNINEISKILQINLKNYIEFYTGIEVNAIDIKIIKITK